MFLLLGTRLLVIAVVIQFGQCTKISYDGYSLLRVFPHTNDHLDHLHKLMEQKSNEELRFWNEPRNLNASVDIMVSPKALKDLEDNLATWQIDSKEIMSNVGDVIKQQMESQFAGQSRSGNISMRYSDQIDPNSFFKAYQPLSVIEQRLKQIAKNPRVRIECAGQSHEGRPIQLVKISNDHNANKPIIFIDALHHAREWISLTTVMYLIDKAIKEPSASRRRSLHRRGRQMGMEQTRGSFSDILNTYDLWFVPVVNPDGYEYTRSHDRLWRKNRSPQGTCKGVDPNRNYKFHWDEAGTSRSPCSEIFSGPQPLSEPESQAIAKIMDTNQNRIKMYISLHAYSQVILCPYGHRKVYPDNYNDLRRVASAGMKAIAGIRGLRYRFGTSAMLLYPAAGGSDDYAHGNAHIRYSYTVELPDEGRYGFLLPVSDIIPVGKEALAGLTAMIQTMRSIDRG